jgi:hypothetical protein
LPQRTHHIQNHVSSKLRIDKRGVSSPNHEAGYPGVDGSDGLGTG